MASVFQDALEGLGIRADTSLEDANDRLLTAGFSDGLPMVPPTPERLAAFLTSVKTDPAAVMDALLMPSFTPPTLWDVAANAVLAGCLPEYLPVVVAALMAMADDAYNLLGVQTTTGTATPIIAVHGPIAAAIGVNGADNCLGQGHRANATIGRAVRLVLQNVGGAIPGVGDMATMGQPGKYTWCFAENEAASPFAPFHVEDGLPPGSSAVTVMAAAGSSEVVLTGTSAEEYASSYARASRLRRRDSQALVLLPPEAANLFFADGWDRRRWRDTIFASGSAEGEVEGSPENLLVMVAGGVGIKGTFIPSWGFNSVAVTRGIETL